MTRRSALVIAATTLFARAQADAQPRVPGMPSLPPTALAVEQRVNDRWLHGGQQPRFTSFNSHDDWMFVDSTRTTDTERRLYITLTYPGDTGGSAIIVAGRTGQVESLHVPPADTTHALPLAETRLWDFVPTFPNETPRIGLAWSDTIARLAVDSPSRQSLRGSRVSRVVGDTVIGGRRLWIVHDSAVVEYQEGYDESAESRVSRTASGTIRGVHVYDPEMHLIRWREDTTRLVGEAVLHYSDGRSLRTPARYERDRRIDMFDAATYAAMMAKRFEAADRAAGGMVRRPSGPPSELERRLSSGDPVASDSIIREWEHATDPSETERLYNMLARGGRDPARRRLYDLRLSAGDTAFLFEQLDLRVAFSSREPIDTADMRSMIHVMDDPSIAWRFNANGNWLYDDLSAALTTYPRAITVRLPHASVSCTVAACRLLGDQRTTAHEPRLRDVGLVALVSEDPSRWADTILSLDGPRHPLLHAAAQLVTGAGATAPMPPPNGDWRSWREWMKGTDAVPAIRFYTARTGRDIAGELRRAYAATSSDSARLVFATLLHGLGPFTLPEAEIVDAFTSRVPVRVALALMVLPSALDSRGERLSDADATSFINRVVAAAVQGTPLWRLWTSDNRSVAELPGVHVSMNRLFVQSDSLPAAVRQNWEGRVMIIDRREWANRDPLQGGVLYQFAPVLVWGRFARVRVTISERTSRRAGEASREYAAGAWYYLMRVNDEWVLVDQLSWIT